MTFILDQRWEDCTARVSPYRECGPNTVRPHWSSTVIYTGGLTTYRDNVWFAASSLLINDIRGNNFIQDYFRLPEMVPGTTYTYDHEPPNFDATTDHWYTAIAAHGTRLDPTRNADAYPYGETILTATTTARITRGEWTDIGGGPCKINGVGVQHVETIRVLKRRNVNLTVQPMTIDFGIMGSGDTGTRSLNIRTDTHGWTNGYLSFTTTNLLFDSYSSPMLMDATSHYNGVLRMRDAQGNLVRLDGFKYPLYGWVHSHDATIELSQIDTASGGFGKAGNGIIVTVTLD